MICPSCAHDNIPGVDACEECGQPLTRLEELASDLERSITEHPVRVLAPKIPVMVQASASVQSAVDTLVENKIGCLLVEENGQVTGIFTERDVLNRVLIDRTVLDQPVSTVMTPRTADHQPRGFDRLCHARNGGRRISALAGGRR